MPERVERCLRNITGLDYALGKPSICALGVQAVVLLGEEIESLKTAYLSLQRWYDFGRDRKVTTGIRLGILDPAIIVIGKFKRLGNVQDFVVEIEVGRLKCQGFCRTQTEEQQNRHKEPVSVI